MGLIIQNYQLLNKEKNFRIKQGKENTRVL